MVEIKSTIMKTIVFILMTLLALPLAGQDDELPTAVESTYKSMYPKGTDMDWKQENDLFYLSFYQNSSMYESVYDKNGIWIETSLVIDDAEVPAPFQDYVKKQYPGGDVSYSEKVTTSDKQVYYRITVEYQTNMVTLKSDSAGKNIEVVSSGDEE